MCASVRVPVPGTDQLVWAQIDPEPFEGRPLLSQAAAARLCRWSIDWERRDRSKLYYKEAVPRASRPHAGKPNG